MRTSQSPHTEPSSPTVAIQVAAQLLASGDSTAAIEKLQELTRFFPTYPTAHVLFAKALEASGQWEEALEAWHQAYFLSPQSPLVQRERSRLLDARAKAEVAPEIADPGDELIEEEPEPAVPSELEPEEQSDTEELAAEAPESEGVDEEMEESIIVEPRLELGDDREIEGTESDNSSWWKKPDENEQSKQEYVANQGWTVLEESAESRKDEKEVEPAVAPPEDFRPVTPAEEPRDDVEDARVILEEDGPNLADELDELITELEDAPRIRPNPQFEGHDETDNSDVYADEMVSETLARIYAAQGEYEEAARVYERLAQQSPEQEEYMLDQAAEMRLKTPDKS